MESDVEARDGEKSRAGASAPQITAHELSDRYVFTETDNTDGWIASDVTIAIEP